MDKHEKRTMRDFINKKKSVYLYNCTFYIKMSEFCHLCSDDPNVKKYHDDDDRAIEFIVQPGDLPTITKLLGREIFNYAKGEGCHQDKCLLIRKTFNGAERYFFPNPIVFQEQLQSHTSKNILLFEDFSKMTNIYTFQNNVVFKPADVKEKRQLFGLHMCMGCSKLPRFRMYWIHAMDLGKFQRTSTISLRYFLQLR
jgi:hypothetical protein